MVLWRVTSYDEALRLEAQRIAQRVYLQHRWGPDWRTAAPAPELLAVNLLKTAPVALLGPVLAELVSNDFSLVDLLRAATGEAHAPSPQPRTSSAVETGHLPEHQVAPDVSPRKAVDESEAKAEMILRRDLPKMRQSALTVYLAYQQARRALSAARLAELSGFSLKQARRKLGDYAAELGSITVLIEEDDATFAKELAEKIADGLVLHSGPVEAVQ